MKMLLALFLLGFVPTAQAADISTDSTFCGFEGGVCSFAGTQTVRYGAGSQFVTRSVTGGTACSNAAFGADPYVGKGKSCYVVSSAVAPPPAADDIGTNAVFCSNENAVCSFTGTRQVRFGLGTRTVTKSVTGGTPCTVAAFGTDPYMYFGKKCYLVNEVAPAPVDIGTNAVWCANEGGTCNFTGTHDVRYGSGTRTVTKTMTGGTACTNTAFGSDPYPGWGKMCFIVNGADPAPAAQLTIPYKIGYTASTGTAAADLASVEGWLGRPLDMSAMTIAMSGWWPGPTPTKYGIDVSFPMLSIAGWDSLNATDMAKAARGDYDAYYTNMAQTLARAGNKMTVRIGWEMNGNWYPWSIGAPGATNNTAANYIATFRRIAKILRANVPNVQIEFCTNWAYDTYKYSDGRNAGTPLDYWPGSDSVDVISMDIYETNIGNWKTTQSTGTYNLDWMVAFAKANHVKVALPEWGAAHGDAAYVKSAIDWMNSLGSLFAFSIYSSWDPADQVLKPGDHANEQAVWQAAWGKTVYKAPTN